MQATEAAITTDPVVRVVVRFRKEGPARFMSHLDLVRTFQRAARRAGVRMAYSQGVNPHPRMTIAAALPVGAAGLRELAAFDLAERIAPDDLIERMNSCLPEGVEIVEGWTAQSGRGTFGTRISSDWLVRIRLEEPPERPDMALKTALDEILRAENVLVERGESGTRDVRSRIASLICEKVDGMEAVLRMTLLQDEKFGARPQDVLGALAVRVGSVTLLSLERSALRTDGDSKSETERR